MNTDRYIPAAVRRRLYEAARNRCCLCREVLLPGRDSAEDIELSLENHHIEFVSAGGDHSFENLAVVDANCHRRIHSPGSPWTAGKIQRARDHWYRMAEVVPRVVVTPRDSGPPGPRTEVPFVVESVNLKFWITCSEAATIAQLAEILKDRILRPLGEYDHDEDWIECHDLQLALRSSPNSVFLADRTIGSIARYSQANSELKAGDAFVARITRHVLAMPGHRLQVIVNPNPPRAGEPYQIAIDYVPTMPAQRIAKVEVQGSDGFTLRESVRIDPSTRCEITIPAARTGITDAVLISVDSDKVEFKVQFQSCV